MTPPKIRPYLTIVADRVPCQKLHTSLGHAKNAMTYTAGRAGTVWGLDEHGEWQLLFEVTAEYVEPTQGTYGRWVQHIPWRSAA